MPDPGRAGPAFAGPLLQKAVPHGACCGRKVLILISVISSFGLLLSLKTYIDKESGQQLAGQQPPISMHSLAFRTTSRQQHLPLGGRQHFLPFASRHHTVSQALPISGRGRRSPLVRAVEIADDYTSINPQGNMVLVRIADPERQERSGGVWSTGGILLPPGSGQEVVNGGEITAVGDKAETLKVGDFVMFSNNCGPCVTEMSYQNGKYILTTEEFIMGMLPSRKLDVEYTPELQPMKDRVLVKLMDFEQITYGGFLYLTKPGEEPAILVGEVIRLGPGKNPGALKEGDKVVFSKYAGDTLETRGARAEGNKYMVPRIMDVQMKVS